MNKILILAAAGLAFSAAPALAQSGPAEVVVSYADLDLSSERDVRRLDRRIRTAVEVACGPTSSADPRGKNLVHQCRTETLAVARAQAETAIADASGGTEVRLAAQR